MRRMMRNGAAICCLAVFFAVFVAGTGFAGDDKKAKKRSVWSYKHNAAAKKNDDKSFVRGNLGVISEINYQTKFIVVGDMQWNLADKVLHLKADGTRTASRAEFQPGKLVIYKFDPSKEKREVFVLQVPNELIMKGAKKK